MNGRPNGSNNPAFSNSFGVVRTEKNPVRNLLGQNVVHEQ